jgi:cyclic pyranopterin phosphate synthase
MPVPGVFAFEDIDDTLPYVPLAGRRVLDALGRKLSLDAWIAMPVEDRARVVEAGAAAVVDATVLPVLDRAIHAPARIPPEPEPAAHAVPAALAEALGPSRPLDVAGWRALHPLARYALAKSARKPDKLARAYDAIVGAALTHLDERGAARMVDVSGKPETARAAHATARVRTTREVIAALASGSTPKGDVLAAARIAGILASKRTPELVPLCHPVRTTRAAIDFELLAAAGEVRIAATVEAVDRTGVEMEAMVAASIAALTVYDMIKSADRWATIDGVRLESKRGGKSGEIARPGERE